MGVYVATDLKDVNSALETIQREITKISKGQLKKADLSAAKEHLIGGIYLASESADGRMMRIAKNEFNFGRYVEYKELVSCLEKVTVEEVIEVSNSIFNTNSVSLSTLGPLEEDVLDKSNLQF
jgi:predicted Zn-dependent peptidase